MTEPKWRGIFDAARHNDLPAVKYFIEQKGISPTETNTKRQTVAHIASMNGNLPLLEYVLDLDHSVLTMLDDNKNNVLFYAIERGDLDMVQFLVECHRADILQTNRFRLGVNAVHIAAKSGNLDILQYFVEGKGANVEVKNNLLETPVFYAAEGQHLHIVQYLVEVWNVNVTCNDWNGSNILYVSAKSGDLSVPKYLMEERGVVYDVNRRDCTGDTVVMRAVKFQQLEFIKYFVKEKGADVNIGDKLNRTPLFWAACLDNYGIVKFLLDSGADIQIAEILDDKTPDKMSTADAVIKLLKKTMADKLEEQKQQAKREKQMERQKVKDAKDREKQKLKEEREAQRKKARDEKELEKQKLREEKQKLREEKNMLKNMTTTTTASKKIWNENGTEASDELRNSSTSIMSCLSNESTLTTIVSDNNSLETVTNASDSRELRQKRRRRRQNAPMEWWPSIQPPVNRQFISYRQLNQINSNDHDLSSESTHCLDPWQMWQIQTNRFLIIADVCFRYLNLHIRSPNYCRPAASPLKEVSRLQKEEDSAFVMKSINNLYKFNI